MSLDPPRPLIPFFPSEYISPEIDFEFALSRYPNCRKDIIITTRDVGNKGARQPDAIICVEETSRGELVSAPDGVQWFDTRKSMALIILPSIWVLKEFSKVVEMKPSAISMPPWKAESGIRSTGGS
jgi:hypothetical protein